jgi:hypothetical protein
MRRIGFLFLLLPTAVWSGQVGGLPCRTVDPALRLPLSDVIGVNTHYGANVDPGVDRFAAAGVRLVRNDLTWEQIEREPGQYDFSGPDRVAARRVVHESRVHLTACFPSLIHCSA